MGKGSGGGGGGPAPTPTQSTVTQTNLPEYAQPYYESLLDRGEAMSEQEYDPYGGARIAGFTPEQQSAFDMQVAAGTTAPKGMIDAQDYYSNIMNRSYPTRTGYGKGRMGGTNVTPENISRMNVAGFTPEQPQAISPPPRTEGEQGMAGQLEDFFDAFETKYQTPISQGPRAFEAQNYKGLANQLYDPGGGDDRWSYKKYMDPYLEDVLDRQRTRGEEVFQQQAQKRADARVARGTRRGSRAAVEEALERDKFQQRMGDVESQQRQQAYLTAQQQARDQFLKDREARMKAAQMTGAERLSEARYGMDAAAASAGIDPLVFQQQMAQAGALQGVGSAQQKMDQANLDIAYQDFLNQRDFERRQLQYLAGLLQGVPVTPQSEVYQYKAPGSFTGQMAGAGLGGLGLYKMLTG